MAHLGGKGPLGLKQPKAAKVKKSVRKRNPKTAARSALELDQGASEYMVFCKGQTCAACGKAKSQDFHHAEDEKMPRSHWRGCGLCGQCHQMHHTKKETFKAQYGNDDALAKKHAALYLRATGIDATQNWKQSKLTS